MYIYHFDLRLSVIRDVGSDAGVAAMAAARQRVPGGDYEDEQQNHSHNIAKYMTFVAADGR